MEEDKKKQEDISARIRIMNLNEKKREFQKRIRHLGSTLATIFISVILSLLLFRALYTDVFLANKNNGNIKFIEGEGANPYSSPEAIKKIYDNKMHMVLAIALKPDDFRYNDSSKVTNGLLLDKDGNIIMPSRILNNISDRVYIKVSNEAKEVFHEGIVLGEDPVTKLALVKCRTLNKLNPEFTGVDSMAMGEPLFFLASPFGSNESANLRITSVFSKNLTYTIVDKNGMENKLTALIASASTVNANDGAMVLDKAGKVIGMTSKALSERMELGNS